MRWLNSVVSLRGRYCRICSSAVTSRSRRWYSSGGVTWLWKASKFHVDFYEANKVGCRIGYGEITLNSDVPIEKEHFEEALKRLQRKYPSLRTLVKERDGELWFCQPDEVGLDFEVLGVNANLQEEMRRVTFPANHSVPWKAFVAPRSPDTPCNVVGMKEKFPHQYDLAVSVQHSVLDGHELVYCLNGIHKMLDDVLSGQPVDDERPSEYLDYRKIDDELLGHRRERLLRDREYFELIKSSIPSLDSVPTILQAFPRPIRAKSSTIHIRRSIDLQTFKALQARCSEAGVAFSSFCVAMANVAALEAIKETSFIKESYKFSNVILVNSRRYMKTKTHVHGCLMLLLSYFSHLKINTVDHFWDYCKMVDHELKAYLKEGRSLDQKIVKDIIEADYPSFNYTDNPKPILYDSNINHMGHMAKTLPGVGQHVQVSKATSFNFIHKFINPFMHEITVFRGDVSYTFSYSTDCFTDETANLLIDKVLMVLHKLSKH